MSQSLFPDAAMPASFTHLHLRRCLIVAEAFAALRAELMALALAKVPDGQKALIYGCGQASAHLAQALPRETWEGRLAFAQSGPPDAGDFHGYPLSDAAALGDEPFHTIFLTSVHYQDQMRARLPKALGAKARTMRDLVDDSPVDAWLDKALDLVAAKVGEALPELRANLPASTPLLLYAVISPSPHFFKTMAAIRENGHAVLLVVGREVLSSGTDFEHYRAQGCFDAIYVSHACFGLEAALLARELGASLIHFNATMACCLPQAALVENKPCPLALEYCDVKDIVFDDHDLARHFLRIDVRDWDIDRAAQAQAFRRSDGVILKDDPRIVDWLAEEYGARPPHLYFPPYIQHSLTEPAGVPKLSDKTGLAHVVYAGCVHNNPAWHPYSHHVTTKGLIRALTEQGIHFTIFNAMDHTGKGFEDYLELDATIERFSYRFSLPYDQLIRELSAYDYGIHCFDPDAVIEAKRFLKSTFGSKIFTYLEAGLPILMMEETEFQYELIRKWGVGVGIRFAERERIAKVIAETDWGPIRENIGKARQEITMTRQFPRLLEFYKELTDARQGR